MARLHELTDRYIAIEGLFDSDIATREEIKASLDNIKEQIGDKVESIAKIVLSFKNSIEVIAIEEERLAKRKQAMVNNMEWLKNYLLAEMVSTNTLKVKRDLLTVAVADNPPSIEIIDLDMIPATYRRMIPETWQPDKKTMIEHFKDTGEIISGTIVVTNKKHITIR